MPAKVRLLVPDAKKGLLSETLGTPEVITSVTGITTGEPGEPGVTVMVAE